ncbi:beta-1,4-mannosyltransferase egh-like isoform X2 [Diabrotica virgifera virgifera]|uniref:Glycosyltransferase 2-like domain-containing protein n=1 Tax=Diabrotica virgifera virgifera TaxID=50390 RepID=A0ABM5JQ92_DIAVI|nr:beta-1,4-mannosyltransferase egh-like isoform X2 [Diabrotica virgifera virgifera]
MISGTVKHVIHCVCLIGLIVLSQMFMVVPDNFTEDWTECDTARLIIFWIAKLATFGTIPQLSFIFLGMLLYNSFSENVAPKGPFPLAPFICFRVVTRGDFPQLVQNTVKRNLETCLSAGLKSFCFDIVTDKLINITPSGQVRETVVPSTYKTKTGVLYKGRALQYCLEQDVNFLEDDTWIVHLDEETVLTESSINAFVMNGKHKFGQGTITYANEQIVSLACTLMDCAIRVADDLGKLKFQLKFFHKMLFSWKGSFMVAQAGAERNVGFDHGVESSLSEDYFFGTQALIRGYSFDFIEGEMWEKSPFTFRDYIKQRARWLQGTYQYATSNRIPGRYKILAYIVFSVWVSVPILGINGILTSFMLTPYYPVCERSSLLLYIILLYFYFFGILHSFKKFGFMRIILYFASFIIMLPIFLVLDSLAVFKVLFISTNTFQIVDKSLEQTKANIV